MSVRNSPDEVKWLCTNQRQEPRRHACFQSCISHSRKHPCWSVSSNHRPEVMLAGSQLCIQPCSIWTMGKELTFQLEFVPGQHLIESSLQVIGVPGFRGVKWSRHSVLWCVSLLMEFCFNPWQRKVPHCQPGGERLVNYVLKNWDFLSSVHQFPLQEEVAHDTELGTDPLGAGSTCLSKARMAKKSLHLPRT